MNFFSKKNIDLIYDSDLAALIEERDIGEVQHLADYYIKTNKPLIDICVDAHKLGCTSQGDGFIYQGNNSPILIFYMDRIKLWTKIKAIPTTKQIDEKKARIDAILQQFGDILVSELSQRLDSRYSIKRCDGNSIKISIKLGSEHPSFTILYNDDVVYTPDRIFDFNAKIADPDIIDKLILYINNTTNSLEKGIKAIDVLKELRQDKIIDKYISYHLGGYFD